MPRVYPLQVLFWEKRGKYESQSVKYSLKDHDHKGFPSLYRLYMELEDTTEWEFANLYLESYEHWLKLCECDWFKPYVTRWRKELELKLRARYLKQIKETAQEGDYQANRYLLDKGCVIEEADKKRGRPTKEISKEASQLAERKKKIKEDYERLTKNV